MLAVSISVPTRGTTINAAIADHVPVAELIPHLVDNITPGEHWILRRAIGDIRPEHTLTDAGVMPGELLELDIATVPAPPTDAVEELSGPVGTSPAVWVLAAIASLATWQSAPIWNPLRFYNPATWSTTDIVLVICGGLAALGAAAGSLHHSRYSYIAPLIAFGVGLHLNVVCACACAALVVWRRGPARIATCLLLVFSLVNFLPGLTMLLALIAVSYAGQIAIAIEKITIPKVPATGVFSQPVHSRAGDVITVHSTVVATLCVVICVCVIQLLPWGSSPTGWTIALLIAVALMGVSARGTRPVHAIAVTCMAAFVCLWLAAHIPAGIIALVLVVIPALTITSPMVGRIIDWVEMVAFAAVVPLALHSTGVFALIRGIG